MEIHRHTNKHTTGQRRYTENKKERTQHTALPVLQSLWRVRVAVRLAGFEPGHCNRQTPLRPLALASTAVVTTHTLAHENHYNSKWLFNRSEVNLSAPLELFQCRAAAACSLSICCAPTPPTLYLPHLLNQAAFAAQTTSHPLCVRCDCS